MSSWRDRKRWTTMTMCAALAVIAACSGDRGPRGDADSGAGGAAPPPSAAALDSSARTLVAFLAGEVEFDRVRLADTVVLYVSPEGGGARVAYPRELLRSTANWRVDAPDRGFSLVPPPEYRKLTVRPGRHLNCMEYTLASRYTDLARLPHVGVMLQPDSAGSCLQSWNVTFVFDSTASPPTLVAAVYDQWEW